MLYQDALHRLCAAREILGSAEGYELPMRLVARRAGISMFHFIRLFKAVFGETPHQCRMNAQLETARHLLAVTDSSVTAICMEVGFSSLGSFSALFSRRIGLSPSDYRKNVRRLQERPGEMPRALIPGCFSLMTGAYFENRNFQEAR